MGILYIIAIILLVFWVLGLVFEIGAGLIHLLLVVALIIFVVRLLQGRRRV